jgi:hypothetical protein
MIPNVRRWPMLPARRSRTISTPRGPALLQDVWLIEKLTPFAREVIPERRMHAKGSGAHGTFTVTHDITRYTKSKIFSEIGKQTPMFARFSTVAGERGAADAEHAIRGFALKFYTEDGNWDVVGNNTPVFFFRDPLRFPDLNHAIKRDPRTGMRRADNNWDFWTLLPEALRQVTIVMSERGIPKRDISSSTGIPRTFSPKSNRRRFHPPTSCRASVIRRTKCFRRASSPMAMRSAIVFGATITTSRSTRQNAHSTATIAMAQCAPTVTSAEFPPTSPIVGASGPTSRSLTSRRCRSLALPRTGIIGWMTITGGSLTIYSAR